MIKYWQSMQDYKYFLNKSKVHFDSSERNWLHSELWDSWQKLRLFDTDKALAFLLPFYSQTGRPAKNQPQILRSFILFFLLYSDGLTRLSLTFWVNGLKGDRVLAALIGCTLDSLPPLGSYFDFMDRLWAAPTTDLYARDKLLSVSWNRKKTDKPKGKNQKAQETRPKITESIEKWLMDAKDIPFNFERHLEQFFYHVAVLPSMDCGLLSGEHLTVSGDGTAVHTHTSPHGHHRDGAPDNLRHFPYPNAAWGWDSDLDKYYFGYTLFQLSCYNREFKTVLPLLLRFTSARRHNSVSFLVTFHELEKHMPVVSVENMCLDSAMDNSPAYRLLKNRGIRASIDLNDKCDRSKTIPDIIIDNDETPLCQENLRMKPNGYDCSSVISCGAAPMEKNTVPNVKITAQIPNMGGSSRPEWDIRLYTDVPVAQMPIKKSINSAPPRNVSTTVSSIITAFTVCSYTQRSIILS